MKPFNLEEYLANPERKVVTRDGEKVRIICTDRKSTAGFPIVALILRSEVECVAFFKVDGTIGTSDTDKINLFFAPMKHEGWVNIYRSGVLPVGTAVGIYSTEEEAKKHATDGCISTNKIEWEE